MDDLYGGTYHLHKIQDSSSFTVDMNNLDNVDLINEIQNDLGRNTYESICGVIVAIATITSKKYTSCRQPVLASHIYKASRIWADVVMHSQQST
jgi:hypothetical protein